ncbi:hypothetical protein T4B_8869 [Trichinella pseudospiralis]|uniref:Uncharacterized protein n=2 Tax=Trichinella pseudospiralis TaxID=6337 RepID=A0A0V1IZX9_TRIPS|nr:hypothetical protein T4B_8869 [Trichinella pseudospiralis]
MGDAIYQFFLYKLDAVNSILEAYTRRISSALDLLHWIYHEPNQEQRYYILLSLHQSREVERSILQEKQLIIDILMALNPDFERTP